MDDIFLESIMSDEVSSAALDTPLRKVIQRMAEAKHSCMIITMEEVPIGIFTERDVITQLRNEKDYIDHLNEPVSNYMSTPLISLKRCSTLFEGLVLMRSEDIRHIPVIDNEKLCGIITQSDIVNTNLKIIQSLQELIENSIDKRLDELMKANKKLKALSLEDSLMGVGNRRAMQVDLQHIHASFLRYGRTYSVILFDVDYFKLYNDRYGHQAGDYVLKRIAKEIQNCVRTADRLYRYGGEELLLLLPETPIENAKLLADRIIHHIEKMEILHIDSGFKVVTTSAGVGSPDCGTEKVALWEDVVEQADRGLYHSKDNGRNQASYIP